MLTKAEFGRQGCRGLTGLFVSKLTPTVQWFTDRAVCPTSQRFTDTLFPMTLVASCGSELAHEGGVSADRDAGGLTGLFVSKLTLTPYGTVLRFGASRDALNCDRRGGSI